MPALTQQPASPTLTACFDWSKAQNLEALEVWGTQPSGESSTEVGSLRLTLFCLGDEAPSIVGISSSAGAAESYCNDHSDQPICQSRLTEGIVDTEQETANVRAYFETQGTAALVQAQALLAAQGVYHSGIDGKWGAATEEAFSDILQSYIAIGGRGDDWGINEPGQTPRFLNWIATAISARENGTEYPD